MAEVLTLGMVCGEMTLGELSKKQLVSRGNTTVVVDNLEREDLVERRHCKNDRRAVYVHLTPKGKRMFEEIFQQHARYVQKLASVLTQEEQEQLSRLLKKLGLGLREGQVHTRSQGE